MPLTPGTKLGVYEVLAAIGAGGMGEVYRAHDTTLDRDVAIKVLPDAFATDPERLARFEREAKVLASLNHPNIAAIYGLEKSQDTRALILELVEGPTLQDRIAKGPIPLDEALPIARQIAAALEAAHEQGIIHRDLKPANVKVKNDGTVKVLDFGLAKALQPELSDLDAANSPTMTMTAAATKMGVIMGTAAYMSPEQAKGRQVDKRADIWAFGVVLYEMLTGRQAFGGTDISETLASVLKTDLDLDALPAETPSAVRTLLRRCLERDVRKRLPHVGVARLEIEEGVNPRDPPDSPDLSDQPDRAGRGRRRIAMFVGSGVLAGVLLATAVLGLRTGPSPEGAADPIRFSVAAPDGDVLRLPSNLRVSPDGRRLGFIAFSVGRHLLVRSLDSLTVDAVPGTDGVRNLLWAPDGVSIAFVDAGGGLRIIDTSGGPARTVAEEAAQVGAWSQAGVILYRGLDEQIYRVADDGGEPALVTELDPERVEVAHTPEFFLSDGRRFVFRAQSRDPSQHALFLGSLDSSSRTIVLDVFSSAEYVDGYLVYQREGTLMAQPFDEDEGRVHGQAVTVLEGVNYGPVTGAGAFSVSRNGILAYQAGSGSGAAVLTWFDRTGEQLDAIGNFVGHFVERPSLSADGRRLVVSRREGAGTSADLWLVDLDRGVPSRFTFDPADDATPVFSPDGARVVFGSTRGEGSDLYERASGGVDGATLLYESPTQNVPEAFSPDGTVLLFNAPSTSAGDIWALPMEADREAFPVVATGFPAGLAVFSPDGRWFAYCEGDSGADQVYVQPFPPDGTRVRMSTTNGSSPQWSGTELFYSTVDNRVMVVDVTNPRQPGIPTELFVAPSTFDHRAVVVDQSGSRFLLPVSTEEREEASITVVLNWLQELQARVPTP